MEQEVKKPALSFGPSIGAMPTGIGKDGSVGNFLTQSMLQGARDVVQAEIAPPSAMQNLSFAQQEAVARGYLRHFVSRLDKTNPETVGLLETINGAIRSQDLRTINKYSPELAGVLSIYANNPGGFEDYNKFSNDILQGQIAVTKAESERAKAQADAATAQTVRLYGADTEAVANSVFRNVFSGPSNGRGTVVRNTMQQIDALRSDALMIQDETARNAQTERANQMEASLVKGLVGTITRGLTPEEVDQVRSAFGDRDPSRLSEEQRFAYYYLENIPTSTTFETVDGLLGQYREGPAKGNEDRVEEAAYNTIQETIVPTISYISTARSADEVKTYRAEVTAALSSVVGASDGDFKDVTRTLNEQSTRAMFNIALSGASSLGAVQDITTYARTGVAPEGMSQQTKELVDNAREYAAQTGLTGFFSSSLNEAALQRENDLKERDRRNREATQAYLVQTGQGVPTQADSRSAATSVVLSLYNAESVRAGKPPAQTLPADFWTNASYVNDPTLSQVFNRVYTTPNMMPEDLLTGLQALASGGVRGPAADALLSHYSKMRLVTTPGGAYANPSMNALTLEERGRLNFYLNAPRLLGPDADLSSLNFAAQQTMVSDTFPKMAERFLGDKKVDDWLSESLGDGYALLSGEQRESVKALASYMIAQSLSTGGLGYTSKTLGDTLARQMDEWFPSGEGYVIQYDSNGIPSTRTQYALSQTVAGYETKFLSHVLSSVESLSTATAKDFAVSGRQGILGDIARASEGIVMGLGGTPRPYLELASGGYHPTAGFYYYVMEFDPASGTRKMVSRKDNQGPLIVSTNDPEFLRDRNAAEAKIKAEEFERAERQRQLLIPGTNIPIMP
jgi:hypothetical protein